jgi:hypothetical protein
MKFPDRPSIGTFSPAKTRDFLTGGDKQPHRTPRRFRCAPPVRFMRDVLL